MRPSGQLPRIDEHSAVVDADPDATWGALLRVVEGTVSSGVWPRFASLLGCCDTASSGPRPLREGSAFAGFHVAAATESSELALAGSHRFSEYELVFRLDDLDGRGTRLRAETCADFPGAKGRVYRALVIGTRGHVLATRHLLDATKRRAERR